LSGSCLLGWPHARFPHPLPSLATVPTTTNVDAQLHDPSRPFPCPECSCRFTLSSSLGGHRAKQHPTDCTSLGDASSHQSSSAKSPAAPSTTPSSVASSHASAAGKVLRCTECKYTCKKKSNLQKHMEVRSLFALGYVGSDQTMCHTIDLMQSPVGALRKLVCAHNNLRRFTAAHVVAYGQVVLCATHLLTLPITSITTTTTTIPTTITLHHHSLAPKPFSYTRVTFYSLESASRFPVFLFVLC
jgi:hypothetical protein